MIRATTAGEMIAVIAASSQARAEAGSDRSIVTRGGEGQDASAAPRITPGAASFIDVAPKRCSV
jgi:hypothetical protein